MIDWSRWLHNEWLLSFVLLALVAAVRAFGNRWIRRDATVLSDAQRRSLSRLRNAAILASAFGLVLIWSVELKTMALSLAAFAVAIVVASKELIMCLSGTLMLRSAEHSFRIGDWIEVGENRGEVIDSNMFSTTVQEVHRKGNRSYTGKTLVLPNSVFLTQPLVNLNFSKHYVFETFELPLIPGSDWQDVERKLRKKIVELADSFLDRARQYNASIEQSAGIDIPDPDPNVSVRPCDQDRFCYAVNVFCPRNRVREIEQALTKVVLSSPAMPGASDAS